MPDMEICKECLRLDNRLRRAVEHFVSLAHEQEALILDGNVDAVALALVEKAIRGAEIRRNAVAQELMAHRQSHHQLSLPKARAAGQV